VKIWPPGWPAWAWGRAPFAALAREVAMKTTAAPPRRSGAAGRRAQAAYQALTRPPVAACERAVLGELELQARRIETGHGPTVLLTAPGERPGSSMLLLSAGLLRKLLVMARAGRAAPAAGRKLRRRLDIRV
jgi:hypothetical protein